MALGRLAVCFMCFIAAGAITATPVGKVISLLEDLKKEVEVEGQSEAKSYEDYACFCKDATDAKSKDAKGMKDDIDMLSAEIADKTEQKTEAKSVLAERKANQEKLSKELDETEARCAKEKAAYEVESADMSKAISSLENAIKAMKDSRPAAAVLLAIESSVTKVLTGKTSNQVAMAKILQHKASVDPEDPAYKFHSNDIIDLCEHLLGEFQGDKAELDAEWEKTHKSCTETIASLKEELGSNKEAMETLTKDIERLTTEIAKAREDLIEVQGQLKDTELYLSDLKAQCEARANDYDQRSKERGEELAALSKALEILTGDVAPASEVNVRALFLQGATPAATEAAAQVEPKVVSATKPKSLSFLQTVERHTQSNSLGLEAKKQNALSVLQKEGRRLGSLTISAFVARAAADPFKKVKFLIQRLIERLLEESKNEATKKGFCDESLGMAEHDRKQHFQEVKDLSRELKGLEAKKDELEEEIETLTKLLAGDDKVFKERTQAREEEKEDNLKSIATAKKGLEAVTVALQVLKSYYSQAARATVFVQASPVDEDTSGPGFSGAYKGKQGGMKAIFGLLEVIQSDFDRTIRKTEEAEEAAHRDYIKFMQLTKMDEGSMSTKKELDIQDLKATRTNIEKKMSDLQGTQDLLDKALQEIEQLKPTCIDSGMSYDERVKKREEEMDALKKALCILDTDSVESEC
mmetsp:Transcript_122884/g.191904  ORF Transcript_122884/g.191904 Transcript_122884/m.191904 type:complete len:697 (-) Transcript_122884:49-2139(-)